MSLMARFGRLFLILGGIIMAKTTVVDWKTITDFVTDAFVGYGIPREDAFRMASTTPAEYMGLNKGKIETGFDADFIVLDNDNKLMGSYVAGKNML